MIIEKKKPSQNDVVSIRLVTGEEIVGYYVSDDAQTLTLNRAHLAGLVQSETGGIGLQLSPIIMGTIDNDGHMVFNKSAIMINPIKTSAGVKEEYIRITSSIARPTAQETSILGA